MATWKSYKKTLKDSWIRTLASKKNLAVTDTIVTGLQLRFYTVSKNIMFYLAYQTKVSKIRRNMQIGRYSDFKNIADIRETAINIRKAVSNGLDPMYEREQQIIKAEKEKASRIRVKDLLEQYYEEYSKTHKRASTQKSDRGQIDRYLNPILGHLWISELELPHIVKFYRPS